jgi:hypothetical protein
LERGAVRGPRRVDGLFGADGDAMVIQERAQGGHDVLHVGVGGGENGNVISEAEEKDAGAVRDVHQVPWISRDHPSRLLLAAPLLMS